MKRTLVLTFLALLGFTAAHAQTPFATLNHNDTISVFYGTEALRQAHSAAVNGDVITLSPGTFTAVDVRKSITIRGAGMFGDTLAGTPRTVINGNVSISGSNDSVYFLTLEGLYFLNTNLRFDGNIYNTIISKCYINSVSSYGSSPRMYNTQFVNCIINSCSVAKMTNCMFVNSVINEFQTDGNSGIYYSDGSNSVYNCLAGVTNSYSSILKMTWVNSILYNDGGYANGDNYTTSSNCIGINANTTRTYYIAPVGSDATVHNYGSFSDVFQEFNGTYTEGMNMALNDSIATNILGSDGTQIGIYGGQAPFNPRVLNYSATVANQSRPDGKLEVTIQPINE